VSAEKFDLGPSAENNYFVELHFSHSKNPEYLDSMRLCLSGGIYTTQGSVKVMGRSANSLHHSKYNKRNWWSIVYL
jgi:hypothetical protein